MSVTITRAAALLGKSRRTIYNRIREGSLATVRVGVSRRVTVDSLVEQPELKCRRCELESVCCPAGPVRPPHRAAETRVVART